MGKTGTETKTQAERYREEKKRQKEKVEEQKKQGGQRQGKKERGQETTVVGISRVMGPLWASPPQTTVVHECQGNLWVDMDFLSQMTS